MSYYKYMVPVYRSYMPELNRTLRSSSVERILPSAAPCNCGCDSSRNLRAASVGPTSYRYATRDYSVLPFTDSVRRSYLSRAASVEPVSTYHRAFYESYAPKYSDFDYKVMSYANRLDSEETTRSYINRYKSNYYPYSSSYSFNTSPRPYSSNYNYYSPRKYDSNYLYDSSDLTSSYKHYRLSNSTLNDRNQRAKSPLITREIDRYYKARPNFLGDVNPGPSQSFRHYYYRHVPYFGGSDYYQYVPRIAQYWNNEVYPGFLPAY